MKRESSLYLQDIYESIEEIESFFQDVTQEEFAGLRDVLVHQYFGILLDRLWIIVHKELPELKEQIKRLL